MQPLLLFYDEQAQSRAAPQEAIVFEKINNALVSLMIGLVVFGAAWICFNGAEVVK